MNTPQIELIEAAEAVIARWETPKWKDVEPTATVIYRLRDAVQEWADESEDAKDRLAVVAQQRDTLIEELRRIGQTIRYVDYVQLELDRVEALIKGWEKQK